MAIHTTKLLKQLRKHWRLAGAPEICSLNGDKFTDVYNDVLIHKKQGNSDKFILLYIKEYGSDDVKRILDEFKKLNPRL